MKQAKIKIIIALTLPIQLFLVHFLSKKPQWIAHYYSNGIYPYISKTLRLILGWIPFSVGDILGLVLLFLMIKACYSLIKNNFKNSISKFLQFTGILSLLYFCFYAFWGLNYFREPLAENLGLKQANYSTEQLIETTQKIIFELNKTHLDITHNDTIKVTVPHTRKQIYGLATNGYKQLEKQYPQLKYQFPSIKSSVVSLFQSYNGTGGYINPITGEAQINDLLPKTGYPATTCHEMAHQIGWAAENDANFVGFLAAISNEDMYFKYSGYRMAYTYCIKQVYKRDKNSAKKLRNTVNKGIYKDYNDSYLHWQQFKNPIEPYFKKGYNAYLKANNQVNGIKSYSYVVDLLIAYFTQKN
ncbi:DUF3810 domain-containing protein [Tenacibaculum finnmarkense]|uniref:DUF3810 domain-containing protein n=1 Tax=Tenacibaculum finnmarkense TaxID=2781243 RepID=UPI001EFA9B05|nr:DUF3810 domain-containing protein [Tenacibaculum finnmarkense]MCG8238229.1 DUF3810 domain-containing protein [Tenacibaculum finnmarkense genomovar ulcerans]